MGNSWWWWWRKLHHSEVRYYIVFFYDYNITIANTLQNKITPEVCKLQIMSNSIHIIYVDYLATLLVSFVIRPLCCKSSWLLGSSSTQRFRTIWPHFMQHDSYSYIWNLVVNLNLFQPRLRRSRRNASGRRLELHSLPSGHWVHKKWMLQNSSFLKGLCVCVEYF